MMIWCGVGGYMITSTIKATLALSSGGRMITKKLLGCARGWLVLEFRTKEKKNFFYQCFGGYWDERNKRFQLGQHPDGWLWNEVREHIHHGIGIMSDDIRHNLTLSTSEWLERFKGEAVDYLLERHSPETLRTLERLTDSEFLKTILEVDGPARRTRLQSRRRLALGRGEDNPPEMLVGCNDNKASPSSTANDTV
jgi:hypothetical protein